MKMSPEEFIKIWQTSKTRKEAAERLGMSETACSYRAHKYRALGIPLKVMKGKVGRKKLDKNKLKDLAISLIKTNKK